MFAKGDLYAE